MLHPEVPGVAARHLSGPLQRSDHPPPAGRWASRRWSCCPIHQEASEPRLARLGLDNYWGYSPIGYFAPDVRFATAGRGGQVTEFKRMVRELHAAGLEVLLDVVYNHTAEGGDTGPTLAFRGIDNAAYYRLDPAHPDALRRLHRLREHARPARRRRAVDLALDSLRYWVEEMHVDGFRFDIAPVLGRLDPEFDPRRAVLRARARRTPCSAAVKLIAEPWDLGPTDTRSGAFRRDGRSGTASTATRVRRFWRGDTGRVGELASRVAGSSDLYARRRSRPARERELRHLPRRLHPARPRELRAQAQRGQRRGEPGRQRLQPEPQLGRRGPGRRPPRSRGSASG